MDAIAEQVEKYLADHKAGFLVDELGKKLHIRKRKLLIAIGELKNARLIEIRYKDDQMVIMHVGWLKRCR